MTVGDKGVVFSMDLGGFNAAGATGVFIAAPGEHPDALGDGIRLTPVSFLDGGLTAIYVTKTLDFQASGPWMGQIEVTTADGHIFTSAPGRFYVNPLI